MWRCCWTGCWSTARERRVYKGRAQRRPEWTPLPPPCARAEERSSRGGARASRASITDSLHLFERSERSERSELCNVPMVRAPQVARSEAEGRGNRGRPFFGHFLSARRKKVTALPGAHPGLCPLQESSHCIEPLCLHDVPGRGGRPRTATYFLLSRQEKVGKEKAPPVSASPAAWRRQGQPALLASWANGTTRTTHYVRSARTGAMSQSTKRTMLVRRPCHCAARRGHRGGVGVMFGPSLRSASVGGGI